MPDIDASKGKLDAWARTLERRAAFEQTYWICVIDRLLDGGDEGLVARFHHQE